MYYSEQKTVVAVTGNESVKTIEMTKGNVAKEYRCEQETSALLKGQLLKSVFNFHLLLVFFTTNKAI